MAGWRIAHNRGRAAGAGACTREVIRSLRDTGPWLCKGVLLLCRMVHGRRGGRELIRSLRDTGPCFFVLRSRDRALLYCVYRAVHGRRGRRELSLRDTRPCLSLLRVQDRARPPGRARVNKEPERHRTVSLVTAFTGPCLSLLIVHGRRGGCALLACGPARRWRAAE